MKSRKRAIISVLILLSLILSTSTVRSEDNALVYVIDIRNEIGSGLRVYIERGIKQAENANADAIIFDVNTPGGALNAAIDIMNSIQDTETPTIAYVNRWAISAGAMISLACDQLVMNPGGSIGDAAPVSIQGQEAGEKIVSPVRSTIRATAERQGRNPDIAAAMVDKRLYLVKLENGEIVSLRSDEYNKKRDDGEQMEVISAGKTETDDGELLTLTTEEALRYGLAEEQADNLQDLLAMYRIVKIDGERKVLSEEAVSRKQTELGVGKVEIIKSLQNATIQEVSVTLADRIVFFITSPVISSLLLSLGMLGLFIEIRTPGFGFPGILGLLCLGLFFGGHALSQIEAEYAALFFVLGVALIVLEIFVIPGFGVAGIAGIVLMLGSVFYVFGRAYEPQEAIFWLSSSVLLTVALAIVAAYLLPKTRTWQNLVLDTGLEPVYLSATAETEKNYLGQTGTAITPLRPAGTIRVGDKRLDALSVGDFIVADAAVKVVEVEGSKIFVEAVEEV
jgi:membrane-bound serine protease (ClpP class)